MVSAPSSILTLRPFAAQFGAYETKGDVLTLTILAAKNPDLVGVRRFQRFKVQGNSLTTEPLLNAEGQPMSKPVTVKFERAE